MSELRPNARMVFRCSECGDHTERGIWRNGSVLCDVCAETEFEERRKQPMARTWGEFEGRRPERKRGR